MSVLAAQCANTSATSTAAAGTAAVAASERQAMAQLATTSATKVPSASGSCWLASTRMVAAARKAARAPEETASIRPGSAGGP